MNVSIDLCVAGLQILDFNIFIHVCERKKEKESN